jgi:hypothetical protein
VSHAASGVVVQRIRNAYASTNVTTSAYVQLDAALDNNSRYAEIFDSSGALLKLAVGASGAEVDILDIIPGGNGLIPLRLNLGQRLAIKSVDTATVNTGQLTINLHY